MLSIILGILGIVAGFFMVWKPQKFLAGLGEQAWMEKVFGPGHGTTGYQAVGIILIIISLMLMTGIIESMAVSIFVPGQ